VPQDPGQKETGSYESARELAVSVWSETVAKVLQEKSAMKGRALLCLTGQTGAGKTTLGREIRRRGLPGFRPTEIAVIDDGVMTAPLFGFINRRVRLPCRERDDLSPFEPYLRGKKLVVYVAIRPEERISRCDVLLRLRCDDKARRERLVSSREDGAARYEKSLRKTDAVTLEADHCFDLRSDSGALWDQL
jgi:hypothetical protein